MMLPLWSGAGDESDDLSVTLDKTQDLHVSVVQDIRK